MPSNCDIFKKYKRDIFIETGSHVGHGIQNALDCGFNEIYSIELSKHFYDFCCNRFKENNKVNLIFGDSSEKLIEIISKLNKPITFWLDGHFSGDNTACGKKYSPLIEELNSIKKYFINLLVGRPPL